MPSEAFLFSLGAAVTWGLSALIEKTALGTAAPLPGLLWRVVGTAAGGLLLLPFVTGPAKQMAAVGTRPAAMLALAGALASVLGQVFMYGAFKRGELSRVSPIAGAWPMVAFLLSWALLGETMTWRKAAGCGLVMAGVWLLRR